ncbi:MAG: EI24 domain-containing protein [Candidatus Sericytochromatia bacterium]
MISRCNICGIKKDTTNSFSNTNLCDLCVTTPTIAKTNNINTFFYLFDGLKIFFKNKELIKLSTIPILISTFTLIMFLILLLYIFTSGLNSFIPELANSGFLYTLIRYFINTFGFLVISVISIFLFLPVSSIVCIPFNDVISEKTENIILGKSIKSNNGIIFSIKEALKLLIFKILILILFFPINFIPVIGNIAYLIILSMLISIDFLDIILARKGYSLIEKINFIRKNFSKFLIYSFQFLLFFWIPIIQVLLIPCSAISATKFFIEAEK